jgi:antitoxin component YwqK of YwqJK toxin-antitoxin module
MVNYENGQIYKLVNSVNDKIYIGSTCRLLCQRIGDHRCHARKGYNSPVYITMRKLGIENFRIVLIEAFPCEDKTDLEAREYLIMRRYLKKGRELLNSTIDHGKRSNEHKRKISIASKGKVGKDHNSFKRGSLTRQTGTWPGWMFQWYEDGKRHSRTFSVKKYTENGARRLAEKVQKKIYPLR